MPPNPFGGWKSSWEEIKYPSMRDHPERTADTWLEGKRLDDNAENLWRIHDKLYDLKPFLDAHPGGREWLELTQGLDVTEAFESHHISDTASNLLPKYYTRDATGPRNAPYTFEENGFYRTLKRKVAPLLPGLRLQQSCLSLIYADVLLILGFILSIACCRFQSYIVAILAGICVGWLTVASHNFFHMKDNFRMYYFNLSLLSYREWRISHVLSHHLHTNTLKDMEISALEPFFPYLPGQKNIIVQYFPVYSVLIYAPFFFTQMLKRVYRLVTGQHKLVISDLIPFLLPVLMYLFNNVTITNAFAWWCIIILVASFHFVLIGVNAAHHHPDIFHDGDAVRKERDWGLHQLDAVADRIDIQGNHFMVLTNFGEHSLHHLFPTLDHSILPRLLPAVEDTCKEFNVKIRNFTHWQLLKGQFQQLARTQPRTTPVSSSF